MSAVYLELVNKINDAYARVIAAEIAFININNNSNDYEDIINVRSILEEAQINFDIVEATALEEMHLNDSQ